MADETFKAVLNKRAPLRRLTGFSYLLSPFWIWTVLILALIITIVASVVFFQWVTQTAQQRFEARTGDITTIIAKRMAGQESILLGGVGLVNTFPDITREQWADYVKGLKQDQYAPGSQGFGYSIFVKPEQKLALERSVRAEGFPDFEISPAGERDLYSTILFLEPFDARNQRAFGYDMWSNPVRRHAMEQARDTGQPALSGIVKLVQETNEDVQNGFLLYAPVYRPGAPIQSEAGRRAAIQGYVYSAFRVKDLMGNLLGRGDANISFRIFDGSDRDKAHLLYASDGNYDELSSWSDNGSFSSTQLNTSGRVWMLEFTSKTPFISTTEASLPIIVAVGGLIINILIFMTIWALSRQRQLAAELASEMTSELMVAKNSAEAAAEREIALREEAQEAARMLELANDDLTQFASIIAHDLRAPLKRIESFLLIIQEEYTNDLDDEGRDVVRRIKAGTIRMRDMLDALHQYTTTGATSLKSEVTDVSLLIATVIDTLQPDISRANLFFVFDRPLYAMGDSILLQHVFFNLLGNALKFTDKEAPEITVSCERLDGGILQISIADNGIGIEPEHAKKVFNMFTRLHNEEEYKGTGVGLAVCKRIINDMGMEIWINTERKVGTEVLFTLAAADVTKTIEP